MMVGKPDTESAHEFQSVWSVSGEINSIAAMQGCNKHCRVYARELGSLQEGIGEACAQGEGTDAHM